MTAHPTLDDASPIRVDQRDSAIDIARGVAIILVVLGHALVGVRAAGADTALIRFLLIAIYSTHMAFFFALSGLLSERMAQRRWGEVLSRIGERILWPYLLWSLVLLTAHHVMSGYTNTALEDFAPWRILWKPPSVMWFLYVLFFAMLLMRLLAPLPALVSVLVGVLAIAAGYGIDAIPSDLRWVGVFLLAATGGRAMLASLATPKGYALAALVMVAMLWLAWSEATGPLAGYPAGHAQYIPALIAGPLLLLGACRALANTGWLAEPLALVGRYTMAIFVTHILITAGARIGLYRGLDLQSPLLAVLLGTILGVLLPLVAARLAERARLSRWLGWG